MKNPLSLQEPGITRVYELLYRLGMTPNYVGFFYIASAVWLAMEEPQRLLLVTKWLYPEVAKAYQTSWETVEHGIRSAITRLWRTPDLLRETLKVPLETKPAPAKFISLLAACCAENAAE